MAGTGRIGASTGSTGSSVAGGKGSSGGRKVPGTAPATVNKTTTSTGEQQVFAETEQSNHAKAAHPHDTTTTTTNNNSNQVTTANSFSLSSIFPPGGYPSIPGLPNLLPTAQSPHLLSESSTARAHPLNPLPFCVDPAALEAARFVHLVSSASVLTLQVTPLSFSRIIYPSPLALVLTLQVTVSYPPRPISITYPLVLSLYINPNASPYMNHEP